MKVFNIKWDTDGEVVEGLPTEMEVPDNFYGDYDAIESYLSDAEGYCVLGGYDVEPPTQEICTPTVWQKTYDAIAGMISKGIRFFECGSKDIPEG